MFFCFFFCNQKTADEVRMRDGSSDVCSSDRRSWAYCAVQEDVCSMPAKQQIPCPLCGAKVVEEVEGFDLLLRVTSDSRIWTAGGRLGQCRSCGDRKSVV